jgi:hypothetical protein
MAPDAKVALFDIDNDGDWSNWPNIYRNVLQPAYDAGARIHSDSWGCAGSYWGMTYQCNFYGDDSVDFDRFVYDNPDMLVLIAAGNDGTKGFYSVGAPASAKNIIAVGASSNAYDSFDSLYPDWYTEDYYNQDSLASFSSLGPAFDGRIKPDLVAPGDITTSAYADGRTSDRNVGCDVAEMSGTSMATPTLAGHAALMQQYFNQGFYPSRQPRCGDIFQPSAALLRALLINSARPLDNYARPNTVNFALHDSGTDANDFDSAYYGDEYNTISEGTTYSMDIAEGDMILITVPAGNDWRMFQLESVTGDADLYYSNDGFDFGASDWNIHASSESFARMDTMWISSSEQYMMLYGYAESSVTFTAIPYDDVNYTPTSANCDLTGAQATDSVYTCPTDCTDNVIGARV